MDKIGAPVFMMKEKTGYTLHYPNHHSGRFHIHCISELTQNDFEFMLSILNLWSVGTQEGVYTFPRTAITNVELSVHLRKRGIDNYILHINLGSLLLSEMNQLEFDELVKDLTMLQTREIGSKVYFQPIKYR